MGVRLYNPTTGRFLQTDPVPGGSANPYDYTGADPTNTYDLDGRCSWGWMRTICRSVAYVAWTNPITSRSRTVVGAYAYRHRFGAIGVFTVGGSWGCNFAGYWRFACGAGVGAAAGIATYRFTKKRRSWGGYLRAAATGAALGALGMGAGVPYARRYGYTGRHRPGPNRIPFSHLRRGPD
jgi:hypothetical protein